MKLSEVLEPRDRHEAQVGMYRDPHNCRSEVKLNYVYPCWEVDEKDIVKRVDEIAERLYCMYDHDECQYCGKYCVSKYLGYKFQVRLRSL